MDQCKWCGVAEQMFSGSLGRSLVSFSVFLVFFFFFSRYFFLFFLVSIHQLYLGRVGDAVEPGDEAPGSPSLMGEPDLWSPSLLRIWLRSAGSWRRRALMNQLLICSCQYIQTPIKLVSGFNTYLADRQPRPRHEDLLVFLGRIRMVQMIVEPGAQNVRHRLGQISSSSLAARVQRFADDAKRRCWQGVAVSHGRVLGLAGVRGRRIWMCTVALGLIVTVTVTRVIHGRRRSSSTAGASRIRSSRAKPVVFHTGTSAIHRLGAGARRCVVPAHRMVEMSPRGGRLEISQRR